MKYSKLFALLIVLLLGALVLVACGGAEEAAPEPEEPAEEAAPAEEEVAPVEEEAPAEEPEEEASPAETTATLTILADETTGNLDGETGGQVIDLLFDLQRSHGTTGSNDKLGNVYA